MRKSPSINPRKCKSCGVTYKPTGTSQLFCEKCRTAIDKERKRKWEAKKYPDRKPKTKSTEVCCVCGEKLSSHINGKPYCNKHYQKMKLYGNPNGKPRKRTNTYQVDGDTLMIWTAKGDLFKADKEDFEKLSRYSWCRNHSGYAVANAGNKIIRMNRFVLGDDCAGFVVDHINGDVSDNRKRNLRVCTQAENSRNKRTKENKRGIRVTENGKHNVRITVNKVEIHIGNYDTIEGAMRARIDAEDKYHCAYGRHMSEEVNKNE